MSKAYRHLLGLWVKLADSKYHYAGKNTSDASLTTNITQEIKNVIEYEYAINEAKKGSLSYPISCTFDTEDNVAFEVLKNSLFGDVNKVFEVIAVFKFYPITSQEGHFAALSFNSIITAESVGGTGQSVMTLAYTISNSGNIKYGSVDMSVDGAKYEAETNTFTDGAFTEDAEIATKIEGGAKAMMVFSENLGGKSEMGEM